MDYSSRNLLNFLNCFYFNRVQLFHSFPST